VKNRSLSSLRLLLPGLLLLFCASVASSCPVCFGAKDAPVTQASVDAIGVLLGCTGLVAGTIGGFAARIYLRLRKAGAGETTSDSEQVS
jgi:hypothetical protein